MVTFDDDRDPGATFLYDRRAGSAELLYRSRPWLDPATLAPMRPVTIASRDGLPLQVVPDAAPRRRAPRPARGAGGARGPVGPRRVGLRPPGPAPGQPRLRRAAGQLPRLDRVRQALHARGRARVRGQDARRPDRRRGVARGRGHRRPLPHRHLRRLLRRLRRAGRRVLHARRLRGGRQRGRALEPGDPGALLPALLAPVPGEHLVPLRRRPRRPRPARRPRGALAAQPGRRDHGAAAGGAGGERPARDQGRVRPDRRGAARPGASRWSTWWPTTRATAS